VNLKQTDVPGLTFEESNVPFAGTVVLVTVWVVDPLFVHFTIEFADTVTVEGLKEKSCIVTSVVPLPGQATSCTVNAEAAVKLTPVMFAPLTVCGLLVGVNVKFARLGVIVYPVRKSAEGVVPVCTSSGCGRARPAQRHGHTRLPCAVQCHCPGDTVGWSNSASSVAATASTTAVGKQKN